MTVGDAPKQKSVQWADVRSAPIRDVTDVSVKSACASRTTTVAPSRGTKPASACVETVVLVARMRGAEQHLVMAVFPETALAAVDALARIVSVHRIHSVAATHGMRPAPRSVTKIVTVVA